MKRLLALLAAAALALAPTPAHAVDESPTIDDTATLVSGKVLRNGDVQVRFRLTCPRGDTWVGNMTMLTVTTVPPLAPDDIFSRTSQIPGEIPTGRCTGHAQLVKLYLITAPIGGVLYPAPRNCSAEYGVTFTGTGWEVAFDRGGADGGPDGPGPALCLT